MPTPKASSRLLARLNPSKLQVFLLLGLCLLLNPASASFANSRLEAAPLGVEEAGSPSFVIFGPESLGLQGFPTDLHLLPDGRILILSQREITLGDGIRWESIRQAEDEQDFIPQGVATDEKGSIFVGTSDGFAKLSIGDKGRWHLIPIQGVQENRSRNWPRFLNAERVAGHWYWHSNSGARLQWDLSGPSSYLGSINETNRVFSLEGNLFVSELTSGVLFKHTVKGLEAVPQSLPADINKSISCSAPYESNQLLVGTNSAGIQIFNGKSMRPLVTTGILSGGLRINDLCQTIGGYYAAAVDTYGIVFFDKQGRIVQILEKKLDHRLNRVLRLHYSPDGVLWSLLNEGVARIEFPSRISHFETMLDSAINYVKPLRFEGHLWLQTNGRLMQGIYGEDQRLTEFTDNTPPVSFVFTVASINDHLFAGASSGVYEFRNGAWELVLPGLSNARLLGQSPVTGRWLYVADNEIGDIDLSSQPYKAKRSPCPAMSATYGSVQDKEGRIWIELGTGSIARIDPTKEPLAVEFLGRSNGIPESWAALCNLDGEVHMNCADRLMCFDEKTQRFSDDTALLKQYPELIRSSGRPLRDALGRLWVSGTDMVRIIDTTPGGDLRVESLPAEFRPFNFYDDSSGVVWMHDKRHFARFDPHMPQAEARPLQAIITHIDLPNTSRSLHQWGAKLPALGYEDNSLAAHFLAPGNPFGQHVTFEIMLEGLDNQWTSTGIVGSAIFNRLNEGSYTLRVRPKVGEIAGREARLEFTIRPPWFRSTMAYLLYAFVLSSLIGLAILLPVYSERHRKTQMEALVNARTRELNEANGLLARQMKETLRKASELQKSEERYRRLSLELEHRVEDRTTELKQRIDEVEHLNLDLRDSQRETDRAAARLQEVNASLMVANHELESFSYSVSHDLRAPLRNITGFIELLQRKLAATDHRESDRHLDIVVSEAKRMGTLIDDLLTFSRIGRAEMTLGPVSIEALVNETRKEFTHDLAGRNITWTMNPLPSVLGDPTLLRQVIANLIGNAIKFTRKTTLAQIEIGVSPSGEGNKMHTFFVRDNGVGFNPKYMDKLFRVFQRLHTTKDFEGTGIGLANVKRIIARHGGRVWAEGSINGGSTFFFTLKRFEGALENPPKP